MLVENLWPERGLANGSIGTVEDIIWAPDTDWRSEKPMAILMSFDFYSFSDCCLYINSEGRPVIPIFRVIREFMKGTIPCTRRQFPLAIAFAITVYRAQGITAEKAVLDFSGDPMSLHLDFGM